MTREEFQLLLWQKTNIEIADDYSLTRFEVRDLMDLYEITRPDVPKGKKAVTGARSNLPMPELPPHANPALLPSVWPIVEPLKHRAGAYRSFVPKRRPKKLHPIAAATEAALRDAVDEGHDLYRVRGPGTFSCQASHQGKQPAILFIDALLRVFEALQFPICADDTLEVCCFGVWIRFELVYRTGGDARRRGNSINLFADFLSPAARDRTRKTFYGRGDKPLEANFNSILLYLADMAQRIQHDEAAWTKADKKKHGTTRQRFAQRRAEGRREAEAQAAAVAAREAEAEAKAQENAEKEARRAADEARRALRARNDTLNDLRDLELMEFLPRFVAMKEKRVGALYESVWSRQRQFLWIVQMVTLASLPNKAPADPNPEPLLSLDVQRLIDLCVDALTVARGIPSRMGLRDAAYDFLLHKLPEAEPSRALDAYDTPLWMGLNTKAEQAMMIEKVMAHCREDEPFYDPDGNVVDPDDFEED